MAFYIWDLLLMHPKGLEPTPPNNHTAVILMRPRLKILEQDLTAD